MFTEDKRWMIKDGMIFKDAGEVRSFFGYETKVRREIVLGELKHYCEYTINDDKSIFINKVYDNTIPFKAMNFKYSIGDIVKTKHGEIEILDVYRRVWENDTSKRNTKTCLCRCVNDGNVFELRENHISQGIGCPICAKNIKLEKENSIYNTRKDLLKYFVDVNDAKYVTCGSGKKVLLKCHECGSKKEMIVDNLVRHGFSCSVCSDHISYPNKFIRCFLKQMNIEFIPEKSFEWSKGKIYDQYIEEYNMIIENHGSQHYMDSTNFHTTFKDQQENDIYKKEMALDNDIKYSSIRKVYTK